MFATTLLILHSENKKPIKKLPVLKKTKFHVKLRNFYFHGLIQVSYKKNVYLLFSFLSAINMNSFFSCRLEQFSLVTGLFWMLLSYRYSQPSFHRLRYIHGYQFYSPPQTRCHVGVRKREILDAKLPAGLFAGISTRHIQGVSKKLFDV